jgi:uncharacterized protein (TIGR02145 family)
MKMQDFHRVILFTIIGIGLAYCKKDNNVTLPEVITYDPLYIASTAATVGCIVESDGGADYIDCGIYISNLENAETTGTKFQIGSDTGTFIGQVTGFVAGSEYFIKAYASNEKGESLGDEISFITPATISDYDENVYETVKIENQLWMAENLRAIRYRNGELIGTTTPATLDISTESAPKYQWAYNGNESNTTDFGRLYTGFVVTDSRGVCPTGWHVPTDAEWTGLTNILGGESVAGGRLKEAGTTHWTAPNTGATNVSLFSALPGGKREDNGTFSDSGTGSFFWSSSVFEVVNAWYRNIPNSNIQTSRINRGMKAGFSVRCLKD